MANWFAYREPCGFAEQSRRTPGHPCLMEVARIIEGNGGGATRAQLIAATSRREFDQALKSGVLIRVARGRFTSPSAAPAAAIAWKLGGFLCLAEAAVRLGWEVMRVDSRPHVLVPQGNRVAREARLLAHVHRGRLGPDDVLGLATGPTALWTCAVGTFPSQRPSPSPTPR